jgi:methionyl-tRNA formyltransferase
MDRKLTEVLVCLDNRVGLECLELLVADPAVRVVAAIVHPESTAIRGDEIRALCRRHGVRCWDVETARADFDALIAPLSPDFLVSLYFDYILDQRWLMLPRRCAVNLHPGYLPFNQGFYYYVWAVLDGTPAGVSIHRMEPAVDAGELISQMKVAIEPSDTGDAIYRKHEDTSIRLFAATWPQLAAGDYKSYEQRHRGTRHKIKETLALAQIDPFERIRAIDLLNRLRVTTSSDGGSLVAIDGSLYRVRVELDRVPDDAKPLLRGYPPQPAAPAKAFQEFTK